MSRLIPKTREELTPEQRETFENILENRKIQPGDQLGGPFDPWVRSPELGRRLVGLGGFLRFRTSVDRRLIELGILITGRFWTAQYEWYAHEPMARDNGLDQAIINAIKVRERPAGMAADEEAVYDFVTSMHENHGVSDEVYATAVEQIGEQGVVEIIGLIGYYTAVSMTLNGLDVQLPEGAELPLRD